MKLGKQKRRTAEHPFIFECGKIYKQVAATEKRDDWGRLMVLAGKGLAREELETASQRCFYSVRAGFPGLRDMNFFTPPSSHLLSAPITSLIY